MLTGPAAVLDLLTGSAVSSKGKVSLSHVLTLIYSSIHQAATPGE